MPSFCAVLNCSNRADREKGRSNYRFPSIVKNNFREGLKLSKVRRENWLAQIFRKDLKSDSHLPPKNFCICFNYSPSKKMKNAFYFILKALFILKIFKFLSGPFWHVGKTA